MFTQKEYLQVHSLPYKIKENLLPTMASLTVISLTYLITILSMMTVPLLTVTEPEMIESEDGLL